jgi:outer membrane protein assembly factor BamB
MTLHSGFWYWTILVALGVAGAGQRPASERRTTTDQRPTSTDSSDWPQWQGPDRNGLSRETGLLKQWPPGGPPQLWALSNLGAGYGSIAVTGDRIFVQGARNRQSVVSVLNRSDGRGLWSKALGPEGTNDRGSGPRGTPTVDGDRVYVLTESGQLACLKAQDGTEVWQRNILRDFGGRQIPWLISESPLVDGDRVIVSPGGPRAGIVALDKMTGSTVWASDQLSDEAGYASPIAADVQGVRVYMTLTSSAGVGVRASDGRLMWRFQPVANGTANIATPVFADNKVFYTSAYGTGGALLRLAAQGGAGLLHARDAEPPRRRHPGERIPVRLPQLDPRLSRVCNRQGPVARPEHWQGVADLRGRQSLHPQRGQRRRPCRRVAGWISGARPLQDRRSGVAELGTPGRQRRSALHQEPGNADGVRN